MRDTFDLIPPEIRAMIEQEEFVDRQVESARGIDQALKAINPNLSLVFVKAGVPAAHAPPGAVPGRWHVRWPGRDGFPSYLPITGPNGEYQEPDVRILPAIVERDLTRPGALDRAIRRPDNRKRRELEAEQRRDELALDLRVGARVPGRIKTDDGKLRKRKRP